MIIEVGFLNYFLQFLLRKVILKKNKKTLNAKEWIFDDRGKYSYMTEILFDKL